jgi:hypothetical protein
MPRRRFVAPAEAPSALPEVPVVHPTAVFSVDDFRRTFRLRESSLRREVRERRLRVSKRCGRYFILGTWILQWLESGELKRRDAAEAERRRRAAAEGERAGATLPVAEAKT